MSLQNRRTMVKDINGNMLHANNAVCECGHDTFVIFMIQGQSHPHYQCAKCNSSYCSAIGECFMGKREG